MKKPVIGVHSTRPVGYVNRQGIFCSTSQKSFAQICAEAAEENDRDVIY